MTTLHPTPAPRSADEQALLERELTSLFESTTRFNQLLGMTIVSLDAQRPALRIEMRDDLIGHHSYGRLHGGVTSSVLDTSGGVATMVAIAARHAHETAAQIMHRYLRIGTIDLRVDFLRPGMGRFFIARASVTRLGGRIASTQMSLENEDGLLIATGAAAYTVS